MLELAETYTLIPLLIILFVGLIVPQLFKKLRIPFVTSLILVGAILGPYGLDYVQSNNVIEFFGFLGMTFLMLMAGLETDLSRLKKLKHKIFIMAGLNGLIPFIVGVGITKYFGYSWLTSILVGTIFISSSVAVVIPSLKSAGLFQRDVGQMILSAILVLDVLSLVALSIVLQGISPITKLPLALHFSILIVSVAAIFLLIPKITKYMFLKGFTGKKEHEDSLRFIIVLVIAVLAYFAALGVHPILAAFIVGLTLSTLVQHEIIFAKFHTLGYGLFVPIFFFIVGMRMDLRVFKEFDISNVVMIAIILGLMLSKFFSGYFGGKFIKLSNRESMFFGSSSIIQITTTLAVTYAAATMGILDNLLVTSIIAMSVVTTIIGPILLKILSSRGISKGS